MLQKCRKMTSRYYIGTSGWSYKHWRGKFYPEDLNRNDWFPYLMDRFNTVELNMSFYRFPFKNMLKGWKKKMKKGQKMTLKANRLITHRKRFQDIDNLLERFYDLASILGEKLGCILFQAPPSFDRSEKNFERMEKFVKKLDGRRNNVIEFRDESWWDDEVYKLLDENNIGFCTVSGMNMPSDVVVNGNQAYFRFHGPDKQYASKYSKKQIKEWAKKIKKKTKKCKSVYCYFNNDSHGYAIENARMLKGELG